ncbi:hypothetical protein K458DRAFT_310598 [Lentithecium fluviatile CBS 122367]|uniref:STB6-like N-terminal domain-containing protein n=1 Tax=Lentithecium fluviatile CBS 122367 TaxID=1168545 RepID=A0A6G1ISM8_9PLEO|nr:hypothetical protein K458DRAFT_310598 [Lentithecium fluviatile CBS 122367]
MSYNLPLASPRDSEKELRKRIPRLQTATSLETRSSLTSRTEQMKSPAVDTAHTTSSNEQAVKSPTSATHQRFVLTDHVAFRYLEEDASTTVLARRLKLEGYEIYLVEQWACSREHPTFIITTYTGDPKDTVWASVIGVPKDEAEWSPKMRTYFKSLNEFHARRKETSLGTLMITNLNGFPSSLTIIPIPEGDMKKHRELFWVNENLKRLGCSGRLGIKLAPPSSATQAKFHQLYRTSDKIPLNSAVVELVKLCQVALVLFGKLKVEYADGLFCDVTERAIGDWWIEFGAEYYTIEPHDGILGPTTVAALLGMLMGARNRLSAYNAPISKDVFDIESTKRAIYHFQKTQRIHRTRQLDRQTLERLRRATAKAANKESWAVPRAFKTTMAELGGKGGEMMMGMVGAGEKAGIADIETVDIDRFVELISGERAKWLWYGKPRKTNTVDMFSRLPREDRSKSPDKHQPTHIAELIKRESTHDGHGITMRESMDSGKRPDAIATVDGMDKERDPTSKRAVIKRATEKIESGSGFNRIKDVVGRRNHQPKSSRDEGVRSPLQHARSDLWSPGDPNTQCASSKEALSSQKSSRDPQRDVFSPARSSEPAFTKVLTQTPRESSSILTEEKLARPQLDGQRDSVGTCKPSYPEDYETDYTHPSTVESSIAGSVFRGIDPHNKLPDETHEIPPLLRRTQSVDQLSPYHQNNRDDNWWPRHLSFSIAEESVLRWDPLITPAPEDADLTSLYAAFAHQNLISEEAKRLRHKLALLSALDAAWVDNRLSTITDLDAAAEADTLQLETLYYPALESYQSLREDAHEIVSGSRGVLQEAVRELGTLSDKLEYEIGSLRSKVDDVEDGVRELERHVEGVEARVEELEWRLGRVREGWVHWGVRVLTGIGKKPE